MASTRWVLTWEMVDGAKCAEARLAAKGYGNVDTSGRASNRLSNLQVASPGAIEKKKICGLDFRNAFLLCGCLWA